MTGWDAVERVNLAFWVSSVLVGIVSLFTGLREFGSTPGTVAGVGACAWLLGGLAGYVAIYIAARVPHVRRSLQEDEANGVSLTDLIVPWIIVGVLGMLAVVTIFRTHRS